MVYGLLAALIAIAVYAPSLWVKHVMRKYSTELPSLPGTGGELAQHLIDRFSLQEIEVEATDLGDHFSPGERRVRLSQNNFEGKSLTAVAVAAHEVGHAIQFHRQEKIFQLRSRYLPIAAKLDAIGVGLIWLLPIIGVLIRVPAAIFALIALSLLFQLAGVLSYLIVLPEEWDASFNKALPILVAGDYIAEEDITKVRRVLKAAALTYFAAALARLLNIGRWMMLLRR